MLYDEEEFPSVQIIDNKGFCNKCQKFMMPIDQFERKVTEYRLKYGPYREDRVEDEIFSNDNKCYHGGYVLSSKITTIVKERIEFETEQTENKMRLLKERVKELKKDCNADDEKILKAIKEVNNQFGKVYPEEVLNKLFYDSMNIDEKTD